MLNVAPASDAAPTAQRITGPASCCPSQAALALGMVALLMKVRGCRGLGMLPALGAGSGLADECCSTVTSEQARPPGPQHF